jgi:diguanylate cyclase (GGDEF)-like protein
VSIIITAYLVVLTVTKCRSEKKNAFLFGLIAILLYVIGNFFEVTSTDIGGAFTGVKVMYIGSCFLTPLFLMFIMEYCDVPIRTPWRILLIAVPFVNLMLVWTTDRTGLIYKAFRYTDDHALIRGLEVVEQGPLYYLVFAVSSACIIASLFTLIRRNISWGSHYRKPLFLLMFVSSAPLIANLLYILTTYIFKADAHGINFTPFILVLTSTIFYFSVLRYDLFDFSVRAKSVTLDIVHDAVIFLDVNNNFSSANDAAKDLIPAFKTFQKGRPVVEAEGWPQELNNLSHGQNNREIDLTFNRHDETKYYKARVRPIEVNDHAIGTVLLIQDTTNTMLIMKDLENAAYTDALTGLCNRRHFMELAAIFLERAKRAHTPCSVLIFDLDLFKNVNDTYGHLAGDEVLRVMAAKVGETMRSYDVLGRYGGEEFVVLMDGAALEAAAGLAERIRETLESLVVHYGDAEIRVTCSVGVAETEDGAEDLDHLLERADNALYRAKRDGRNLVRIA